MSNYKRCEKCKDWHWIDEHCLPEYLVYHEEYRGDEPKAVRAVSHEYASVIYGEYYNQDDYPLMDGNTIKVKVEKDGVVKYFEVGAEPDIHYSSTEIETLEKHLTT